MEYSFRNSAKEELTSILLDDYRFILRQGRTKEIISYANIVAVRISRSSDLVFKIHLIPDGHRPICISSWTYQSNGASEDQRQGYSNFVRVLHHHLKDKSPAVFSSGGNVDRIWQWILISAIFSFIISVTAGYLGFGFMNPYIQALVLFVLAALLLIVFSIKKLPRTYKPTEIPVQYLP